MFIRRFVALVMLMSLYPVCSYPSVVNGTISNLITENPIDSVYVQLYDDAIGLIGEALSNEDGWYEINELEDGIYSATISVDMYLQQHVIDIIIITPDTTLQDAALVPYIESDIEGIQTNTEPGTWVLTQGIVTQPTNTVSLENTDFYIQDETGYGIRVFSTDPWVEDDDLQRGNELQILGIVSEVNGITQLEDYVEIEMLSYLNPIPATITGNTSEIAQNSAMEGSWALVAGYLQEDPEEEGSYTVHLDDSSGECAVWIAEDTGLDLTMYNEGDWIMVEGIISLDNDEVQIIPSLTRDVYQGQMYFPYGLEADITNDILGEVTLSWEHDILGEGDELAYDNNTYTGSFHWVGNTSGTRMSPPESCQVLALKYLVHAVDTSGVFNAEVYGWGENSPDTTLVYTSEHTGIDPGVNWQTVMVSEDSIFFDNDFVVGFGSSDETARLTYDSNLNNHRSWDYDGEAWTDWTEAYMVRVVVLYGNGIVAELAPVERELYDFVAAEKVITPLAFPQIHNELDEFLEFIIYRNDEEAGRTLSMTYVDTLPDTGAYTYRISSLYHEGETEPSEPAEVYWQYDPVKDMKNSNYPQEWLLVPPYPNPFNSYIQIKLEVPVSAVLDIVVFDILGRQLAILHSGQTQRGTMHLGWDAAEHTSGIYFLRIKTSDGFAKVKKMVLIK